MKNIDVLGIGNALVDLIVSIDEKTFTALELEKASMRLVSADEQATLLTRLGAANPTMISGGSVANSIYAVASFGGKTALSASIGNDTFGDFYHKELQALGTQFASAQKTDGVTGTCLVMVTPDAERTMRTCLGVSSEFGAADVNEEIIKNSQWCLIEGYLLANPSMVDSWLDETLAFCRKHDTKIAFTASESWVVENFRPSVDKVLKVAELVFANEAESFALTGQTTAQAASDVLKSQFPLSVVTAGAQGAFIAERGKSGHIPAKATTVTDLNGAGDALAGGTLYSLARGKSLTEGVTLGCALASHVISMVGARYKGDFKKVN